MTRSSLLLLLLPVLALAACAEKDEDDGDDADSGGSGDDGWDDTVDSTRPDTGGSGCEAVAVTEVADPDVAYGDMTFTVAEVMRGRDGKLSGAWSSEGDGEVPLTIEILPAGSPSLVEQEATVDTGWGGGGTLEDTSYEETGPDSEPRCPDYYEIPVTISLRAGDTDAPVLAFAGSTAVWAASLDGASWSLQVDIADVSGSYDPGIDPAEWDEVTIDVYAGAREPVGWRGDLDLQASRTDGDIGEGMIGLLGSFQVAPEGGPGGDSGAP
ncbi:MAG: hypothetical protein H6742_15695 [Alphaproteobacteria bacterium]|nr:hypothetical protein [Alphaproteobacteria bacterium]